MESKNKFWKGALVGALLTALAGLVIVGMSLGIFLIGKAAIDGNGQTAESAQTENQQGNLDLNQITSKIQTIQAVIDKYYLFDEDTSDVEDWIYKGMLSGLGDPYTVYYTADEYNKLKEDTSGEYCGIGVMVSQSAETGIITITKVFEGTPGAQAGILPGDLLYKVGDQEVTGMDLELVVKDHIKGEEGTPVTITVLRKDTGKYIDMTMERRQITVPTVEHEMLADKVGYISVSQFDSVTADQFKAAIDDLEKQGMKKLVVDLRNNPGGIVDSVVSMLDYILPDNLEIKGDPNLVRKKKDKTLLVYMADKNGKGEQYYAKDGHQIDVPMAVLVNGQSASASEVFSGALKDYGRAKLVGTKTFGKGIVQTLFPLDKGTAIKMTVAHYYTPNGFDLHKKGLEPDVPVELKEELKTKIKIEHEEDNQLMEAIKALK
ncbi:MULTISPECIES: S41 family peptidase [Clostridia]|uniref:S41 family peptidase n=1 Tax=Lacrimispora xylanolytica TaxID=29375 RepID=A0ABY7ADI4_9FIRM|nr:MULTISPECIES: S41 family peptidase [Clostridia]MBS5958783.1 S41 family peptidase [Clostridiales bacterium]WAJ24774.1 S41 family peptidase [Lacrimispora xylanolytica]